MGYSFYGPNGRHFDLSTEGWCEWRAEAKLHGWVPEGTAPNGEMLLAHLKSDARLHPDIACWLRRQTRDGEFKHLGVNEEPECTDPKCPADCQGWHSTPWLLRRTLEDQRLDPRLVEIIREHFKPGCRGYASSDMQIVSATDASNLADALERAWDAFEHANSGYEIPEDWLAAKRRSLRRFVEFCRGGCFEMW